MKFFRIISFWILLLAILPLTGMVYRIEMERRQLKEDLIELSKIKYGLFNVDEWKKIISGIIAKKIDEFDLGKNDREELRSKITLLLTRIIKDLQTDFNQEKSKTFRGRIERSVASFTGIFNKIEKDIPKFTEQILDFMKDPKNRDQVRRFLIHRLDEYSDKTFSEVDYSTYQSILQKYQKEDGDLAREEIQKRLEKLRNNNSPFIIIFYSLIGVCGLFLFFFKSISGNEYFILSAITLFLLITGLLLPMIEIDARISVMNFHLLGEAVSFRDQVLYFKSKSILEVVRLMITQSRVDLIFVGLLVFAFSVFFPMLKLIATMVYLNFPRLKQKGFLEWMIFKTGKWSMADVMVIAIFMAYIGFSGIITDQLKHLEFITQNMDILTTNHSNLQIGYFSFTSFALLSILISHKLQYQYKEKFLSKNQG